jgi:hypothetical protein
MEQMNNKVIFYKATEIGFEVAKVNKEECILFNNDTNAILYLDLNSKYFQTPYVIVPREIKDKTEIVYFLFDENILCKLKREPKKEWPILSTNKTNYFAKEKDLNKVNETFKKILESKVLQDLFGEKNKKLFIKIKESYQR